jgi:hypothetical protein
MLNRAPKPGGIRAIVERERREREQEKATVRAIIECEYRAAREDARAPEDDNIAAYFDRSVAGLKELLAGLDDPAAEVGHFQWAILHFEQAIRALQIEYSDLSSQRRNGARYKALRSKIHDIRAIAGLRLHRKTLAQLASELGVSLRQSEPMSVSALRSLDAWIATQPDQPSRSEAMQLLALITGLHKLETRAAMETANTHTTRK